MNIPCSWAITACMVVGAIASLLLKMRFYPTLIAFFIGLAAAELCKRRQGRQRKDLGEDANASP